MITLSFWLAAWADDPLVHYGVSDNETDSLSVGPDEWSILRGITAMKIEITQSVSNRWGER